MILFHTAIHSAQPRIADETSLTRWHFAIVIIEKSKRFYTLSSCRVIIKSWIILQFTALVELINVSSRSPRNERSFLPFALPLFLSRPELQRRCRVNSKLEIKNSSRVDYYRRAESRNLQKWSRPFQLLRGNL